MLNLYREYSLVSLWIYPHQAKQRCTFTILHHCLLVKTIIIHRSNIVNYREECLIVTYLRYVRLFVGFVLQIQALITLHCRSTPLSYKFRRSKNENIFLSSVFNMILKMSSYYFTSTYIYVCNVMSSL